MTELRHRAPDAAAAVLIAGVAVWLFSFWGTALAGADAPGYFIAGRMMAAGATTVLHPESPAQFIGAHWLDAGDGRFVGRYPPGLPFLISILYRLGGPTFALILNPVLATLAVLLFYLLARRWVSPWLAVAGSAVFAALAPVAEQALFGFSHMATMTALLASVYFLERWHERPNAANGVAAGFLMGVIPTIRYPEAILTLVLALAVLLSVRSSPHRRALWYVVVGAAIPVTGMFAYNDRVFGSPLSTGYGLTMEQSAFAFHYFVAHFVGYLGTLARNVGPAVVLGTIGIGVMILRPATRGRGLLLAALIGPITAMYMAFFWPFADVRYLLPTLPLYVLGAVWLLDQLQGPSVRRGALALFLLLQAGIAVVDSVPRTLRIGRFLDRTQTVRSAVLAAVPEGSVVVAPPAFESLLEYDGRWKLVEWSLLWQGPPPPRPSGVPAPISREGKRQASPQQLGKAEALRRKYASLGETERVPEVLADALEWADGAGMYWIGSDEWTSAVAALVGPRIRFERVHRIAGAASADARTAEPIWWLPELPVNIYRVHLDAGA
jgi:hypothetical protein